jgi:putative FmdB family regulatory protein
MPTYDYFCPACKHAFERFESIGDDAPKACPECGKKKAKRRIGTGAGLIFKGAGFYVTDYKSKTSSGSEAADKAAAKSSEKKPAEKAKESPKKEGKESKK